MRILCLSLLLALLACISHASATEFHVAVMGQDDQPGTADRPLRTISAAARLAQPGDVITVHAGTYRERVTPPRGGESDAKRIVYQAAPGEQVEIKGSEVVTGWVPVQNEVWQVVLPNSFFGDFNPYRDQIYGDWFDPLGRDHHTGAVYLDGEWLTEADSLDPVLQPVGDKPLWLGCVDEDHTTLWAQFPGVNPNEHLVEVNVRRTVFYPDQPGRNYITVRGFTMRHAATPWAPPTAEQIGLIGTHWSKGWIIEDCVISHSICSGITLGKYGDEWDNTSANTAEGYVKTIERATANGWHKDTIGHHIVRNNTIHDCEQTGICGSLGAIFSQITGNHIYNIWAKRLFTGAEMGGIKLHAAIDVLIQGNRIHNAGRGLWMDWMAQGTRLTGNLLYDNTSDDLFVEVNHGPFLVDNNVFLSGLSVRDWSQGGAYVHNLFAGRIESRPEQSRETPYHPAHSTEVAGLLNISGGDNRFYNNLFLGSSEPGADAHAWDANNPERFVGYGLWVFDTRERGIQAGGNVYFGSARPYAREADPLLVANVNPQPRIAEEGDLVILEVDLGAEWRGAATQLVTTALLGTAAVSQVPFVQPDASPLSVDRDYFGRERNLSIPSPGPFENPGAGPLRLRVWPADR